MSGEPTKPQDACVSVDSTVDPDTTFSPSADPRSDAGHAGATKHSGDRAQSASWQSVVPSQSASTPSSHAPSAAAGVPGAQVSTTRPLAHEVIPVRAHAPAPHEGKIDPSNGPSVRVTCVQPSAGSQPSA